LFLGGYLININIFLLVDLLQYINFDLWLQLNNNNTIENLLSNYLIKGLFCSLILGLKSCIMIFIFIWVRASFPRTRFDQLMSFCWTVLLPLVIAIIILVPCILYIYEILPNNIFLL
jgi:NADH-ubiquinone oxidoreductase chain 1